MKRELLRRVAGVVLFVGEHNPQDRVGIPWHPQQLPGWGGSPQRCRPPFVFSNARSGSGNLHPHHLRWPALVKLDLFALTSSDESLTFLAPPCRAISRVSPSSTVIPLYCLFTSPHLVVQSPSHLIYHHFP